VSVKELGWITEGSYEPPNQIPYSIFLLFTKLFFIGSGAQDGRRAGIRAGVRDRRKMEGEFCFVEILEMLLYYLFSIREKEIIRHMWNHRHHLHVSEVGGSQHEH